MKSMFKTPYYLINENRILQNLKKIRQLKEYANVKSVLALKCFATWSTFDLISRYMDGTTSSSVYEARLGHETFGKEVHAYSVAYSEEDITELKRFSSKIIFNSISQLNRFYSDINNGDRHIDIGLRVNPQLSYSNFDLADPARQYSRLGERNPADILNVADMINGIMFHYNCENEDYNNFSNNLDIISSRFAELLHKMRWVSLGGGLLFTADDYPLELLCRKLKAFSNEFDIQVYLEPGEAVVTYAADLVTQVLDIVNNEIDIAILDASTESHMPDLLIYRSEAEINNSLNAESDFDDQSGSHKYMLAGCSCLAGDTFGSYSFNSKLKVGDIIHIANAAGYTMVKKNWFNGLKMPSIVIKRLNGSYEVIKTFGYNDFKNNLS